MRFKRLTTEELAPLEKEFVQFLASCGVEAQEWERLKKEDTDKVEEKIEQFSDLVIGTILKSAKYIEHRSTHDLRVFKCGPTEMELMALHSQEINLLEPIDLEVVMDDQVEVFKASKPYAIDREDELFRMMEQGCVVTDNILFDLIKSWVEKSD